MAALKWIFKVIAVVIMICVVGLMARFVVVQRSVSNLDRKFKLLRVGDAAERVVEQMGSPHSAFEVYSQGDVSLQNVAENWPTKDVELRWAVPAMPYYRQWIVSIDGQGRVRKLVAN